MNYKTAVQNKPGFGILRGLVINNAEFIGRHGNRDYDFVAILSFQPYEPGTDLEELTVLIPSILWERRYELFRGGHRLFIEGIVDRRAPVVFAWDAWYWRGQGLAS